MTIDMFSHKEFVNRLNLFMKNINKNGNDLARIARVKPQAISGYKKNSFPKAEVLTAWANELSLNINWLLTGEGEMFGDDAPTPVLRRPQALPNPEHDARTAELEAELRVREKELLEAKTEIIALQRTLLERHPSGK